MFIYTEIVTGFDASFGQTFKQKAVRKEENGFFTILRRTIVLGGSAENVPEFTVSAINVSREEARKLAANWIEGGMTIANTKEFADNIDEVIKERKERRAKRNAERAARRGE